MSTEHIPASMQADFARWKARTSAASGKTAPAAFSDVKIALIAAFQNLPEKVEIPFSHTEAGIRAAQADAKVPPEFKGPIDRKLLRDPESFDRVVAWDGKFPGPCLTGPTSGAKTRAAFACLRRLWVDEGKGYSWRPVRKLITSIEESGGEVEGLLWRNQSSKVWFIDDADKINWQFQSNAETLFSFYDVIYRQNIPCITTTNKDRRWWTEKMGEAFVRRLFDEAHFPIHFK